MTKNWKDYLLPLLIGMCAISVSASAAIYSVSGLAKLFAGASFQVMVMAGSLEVAKLVIATLLHQYWSNLNKLLRFYLTTSVAVLVLITSMGIYGFLSSAYQNTAVGFETASKEIAFLKQKEEFYQKDLDRFDAELNRISTSITDLSQTKARELKDASGTITGLSTTELRIADGRIRSEESNRARVLESRNIVADSLKSIQTKILNLEVTASSNAELGPLIYLSELTGRSMDEIINMLLLVIIFVFDPLAISLVLAANFAFDRIKNEQKTPEPVQKIRVVQEQLNTSKPKKRGRKPKMKKPKKLKKVEQLQEEELAIEEVIEETPETVLPETNLPIEEPIIVQEEVEVDVKEQVVEKVNDIPINVVAPTKEAQQMVEFKLSSSIDFTFKDIVKVLQKAPTFYAVLLKNGRRTRLTREEYSELQRRHELEL